MLYIDCVIKIETDTSALFKSVNWVINVSDKLVYHSTCLFAAMVCIFFAHAEKDKRKIIP